MSTEQILVVPRSHFDEVGAFQGFRMPSLDYSHRFFQPGVGLYMSRAVAETDPFYKQIIPYCLITQGKTILTYTRGKSGGETRLHAKRSVGIGGHINPIDGHLSEDWPKAYMAAIWRELREELLITGKVDKATVSPGMLNDDSDDVGKVHLGFVEVFALSDDAKLTAGEDAIQNPEFVTLDDAFQNIDQYEKWSQYVLNNMHVLAPWVTE